MAYCRKYLHLDVRKTADACDGSVLPTVSAGGKGRSITLVKEYIYCSDVNFRAGESR